MSLFTDSNDWCARVGGIRYRTHKPLPWEVGYRGSGLWAVVPSGFVFDVSVPRGLRWLVDPHDRRFLPGAALHDYLLAMGWDRPRAAAEFHLALKACGVVRWRRGVMFVAVAVWRFS